MEKNPNLGYYHDMSILPLAIWLQRAETHQRTLEPYTDTFVKRRKIGQKHPVHDFLFTYYSCSPLKLKQWVPSFEEELEIDDAAQYPWLKEYWFSINDHHLSYNWERLTEGTRCLASFIASLCDQVLNRPPRFSCFGLHEWAMVYQSSIEEIRHQGYKLRLNPKQLAEFVESQSLCCSHYDAFRFFTPQAIPRNSFNPTLETRLQMEQGGCVHVNMDLYKWSSKLWPWIGSDFIRKTFLLAVKARELDMRASPYDLKEIGYQPICIETEEGRTQYRQEQMVLAHEATVLRKELLSICNKLLTMN